MTIRATVRSGNGISARIVSGTQPVISLKNNPAGFQQVNKLADLQDVDMVAFTDGDILVYDSESETFILGPIDCGFF